MATRTGESGEEPATVLDNNTGVATTADPLTESSTSSTSSSAAVPILTESTATSAGNLSLTGSQQSLQQHQVPQPQQQQQQQQSRQRVNLITDVATASDVAGNLSMTLFAYALVWSLCCR